MYGCVAACVYAAALLLCAAYNAYTCKYTSFIITRYVVVIVVFLSSFVSFPLSVRWRQHFWQRRRRREKNVTACVCVYMRRIRITRALTRTHAYLHIHIYICRFVKTHSKTLSTHSRRAKKHSNFLGATFRLLKTRLTSTTHEAYIISCALCIPRFIRFLDNIAIYLCKFSIQ